MPEERDDQREADRRFGGGDGHDEKGDDLPVDRPAIPPDGDERDVHRVEHDLDREQDRDQVAAQEHAGGANRKEHPGQDQVFVERRHQCSLRAMTTAPTIDTRIRTDVTSKANEWVVTSAVPMCATLLTDDTVAASVEKPVTPMRESAQAISI